MDQHARLAHLQELLGENAGVREHLAAHRDRLLAHHASRERDRALLHAKKAMRRAEKMQRSLERAIRNEGKQHSR
ncbi:MAG TPA: hypothetical protein VI796_04095 [Candidatus Thermoplasmatota archaeon]|nr:hypothetical protein [Candidatus Thermoplasmatota archaeon]